MFFSCTFLMLLMPGALLIDVGWKYLHGHIRHGNGRGMLKLPGHVSLITSMLYTNCCVKVHVPIELHGS